MMSYEAILEKVIALFSTLTDEEVAEDSELLEDLDLNSMDVLMLVTTLEGEFGIRIPEKELRRITTVGDVAALIEQIKG